MQRRLRPASSKATIQLSSQDDDRKTGGTPSDLVRYCCADTFLKHVAFSRQAAVEQAAKIMQGGSSRREICTTFVLNDEEARKLYLEVLTWRLEPKAAGNYVASFEFHEAVEATLTGMKLWTGSLEAEIGFNGTQAYHLAGTSGGSSASLGGSHKFL